MKRFTEHIFVLMLLGAACMWSLVSCISEDRDDCRPTLNITFSYTLNPDNVCYFLDEVSNVRLYFYDTDGILVFTRDFTVSNSHTYSTTVPKGTYHVVAWGNVDNQVYSYASVENESTAMLITSGDEENNVPYHGIKLFYGDTTLTLPDVDTTVSANLEVVRVTNTITVNFTGMPVFVRGFSNPDVSATITGTNRNFDFSCGFASEVTYLPVFPESTTDRVKFNVNHLRTDSDLMINAIHTSESDVVTTLLSTNLVQDIISASSLINTNEDLLRYSDYELTYKFDRDIGAFVLAGIRVEDWGQGEQTGDL